MRNSPQNYIISVILFLLCSQQVKGVSGLDVFYSRTPSLDLEQLDSDGWEELSGDVINLGLNNDWNHLSFISKTDTLLHIDYPSLDSIIVWSGREIVSTRGAAVNNHAYAATGNQFIFELKRNEKKTISIKSNKPILVPLKLVSEDEFSSSIRRKDIFLGAYVGLMLVMILFNLFIWLSVRDLAYLVFIGYAAVVCLLQVEFQGYGIQFLWDAGSAWSKYGVYFLSYGVGLAGMAFFATFLRPHEDFRSIRLMYYLIPLFYGFSLVMFVVGKYDVAYKIILGTAGLLSVLILSICILLVVKGKRLARYYLISSGIVVLSVIAFVLKDVGVLPFNFFTFNSISIGSGLEVTMLSFALADRINILTAEKKRSQARALQALRENERIIREQNQILEVKVSDRTKELEQSNRELNEAYSDLQNTQLQLVEAEKMASLGQMTAGIAHELNNPINYVSSNINPLRRDMEEVFQVLDTVEQELPAMDDDVRTKINKLRQEIDLPFVREEISNLLNGIEDGASRSAAIVKGLRIFSRLDEDTLKVANINDGLDSTLIILKSNYKNECLVNKDLDPDLPLVECYPGKLNQVFMNIMTNAIQATKQSDRSVSERVVNVRSKNAGSHVEILIQDNGPGMDEETRQRIFEPFFTTKKVGEGTGLGLSIVLGIIEQHHGKIQVDSKIGVGTTFRITLPLSKSTVEESADG